LTNYIKDKYAYIQGEFKLDLTTLQRESRNNLALLENLAGLEKFKIQEIQEIEDYF